MWTLRGAQRALRGTCSKGPERHKKGHMGLERPIQLRLGHVTCLPCTTTQHVITHTCYHGCTNTCTVLHVYMHKHLQLVQHICIHTRLKNTAFCVYVYIHTCIYYMSRHTYTTANVILHVHQTSHIACVCPSSDVTFVQGSN